MLSGAWCPCNPVILPGCSRCCAEPTSRLLSPLKDNRRVVAINSTSFLSTTCVSSPEYFPTIIPRYVAATHGLDLLHNNEQYLTWAAHTR